MKNFCIGDEVLSLIDKNRKTGVILDIFDDHHLKYKVKWNSGGVGRCSSKAITSYSPSIPILEDYKVTVSDNTGPFKYEECSYPSQYSLNVHEELTKQAKRYIYQFKDFVQMSRDVSQGGVRRGAWAGYISIEHDDFWEILTHIQNNPDDANIGWIISDKFIERLEKGDSDAISRYQKSLKVKCVTGKGYYWFVDKVNKLGWVSPEEQEENIAKLDSEYISIEEHERIVREDKINAHNAISACQEEYKTILTRLADEVFEKAYMDLTMWKAEELKQLILDKINDDSLS